MGHTSPRTIAPPPDSIVGNLSNRLHSADTAEAKNARRQIGYATWGISGPIGHYACVPQVQPNPSVEFARIPRNGETPSEPASSPQDGHEDVGSRPHFRETCGEGAG